MPDPQEVTFVTAGGGLHIRMTNPDSTSIVRAAKTLGARYFVTKDGFDEAENLPIWGVFDASRCDKVTASEWAIPDPFRTFTAATADAGVMFALARMSR